MCGGKKLLLIASSKVVGNVEDIATTWLLSCYDYKPIVRFEITPSIKIKPKNDLTFI